MDNTEVGDSKVDVRDVVDRAVDKHFQSLEDGRGVREVSPHIVDARIVSIMAAVEFSLAGAFRDDRESIVGIDLSKGLSVEVFRLVREAFEKRGFVGLTEGMIY